MRATALLMALAVALSGASFAQSPKPKAGTPGAKAAAAPPKPGTPPTSAAPTPPPPLPYEPNLLRLSELLGTLAYLRDLCGYGDGAEWRRRMSDLLQAEGDTPARKERLAGAFNRGFRGYQATHHACTAAARAIIERALDEGEKITRDVTSRYAG